MSEEKDKAPIREAGKSSTESEGKSRDSSNPWYHDEPSRRTFFKRILVGGAGALAAGVGSYGLAMQSLQGRKAENYPEIDQKLFKRKDQRDTVLTFVHSKALNKKHPERNEQYNRLQNKDLDFT